ncbi:hypothetical protein BOTBODRAFT_159613 [Botryobasidium botryosum FD-172 SS1]|uniref:Glucose-methanol-choline oxidoreductase N-terminal domain-containing protein n=1 Tax=Botryobasidium botryosum (strain FD-172 SS1) TaxID=930990 RepID=A0A067MI75_BOTB1|nr:hypothetical protein BOTBODRAFT_159613 [Botryobasidium botryosum FD-172 SS1]
MTAILEDVANRTFDYVIIGGGTAGLVLAARLSEDPSVSVCVLEAGGANSDEPAILIPGQYGGTFMNPLFDWSFASVPQANANNSIVPWFRGKGLGGSSGMNFSSYHRPPAHDIDAFERLGNPGWNWDRFMRYSKKAETFQPPTAEEIEKYSYYTNQGSHGSDGPLRTSFPSRLSRIEWAFHETFGNLGIKRQKDPMGGNITGLWTGVSTLDRDTGHRSYSANAYLAPNASRKNLQVLTAALATRLIFAPATDFDGVRATGAEFLYDGGKTVVHAREEVILSAGTLKSSQILELSGIGDPNILAPLGIDVLVDLPGVGANIQEHIHTSMVVEIEKSDEWETYDVLREDPQYAREQLELYKSSREGAYTMGIGSFAFLPLQTINPEAVERMAASLATKIDKLKNPALREQWTLQLEALKDKDIPDCEFVMMPQFLPPAISPPEARKKYLTLLVALNHPLSRGTIHITSDDPIAHPAMDPHNLEQDEDLQMLVEMLKYLRRVTETDPLKSIIVKELSPGPKIVNDEELKDFSRSTTGTLYHTAGSCSMLPREKGGVVDHKLKVYGTTNVRVVDMSILPLHVMAHTQGVVYAMAEQAADIIKEDALA